MSKDLVTSKQYQLPLGIEKEVEIDGVGMGVLTDGTPYLTARGLARICGVNHTLILRMARHWAAPRKRERRIQEILAQSGIVLDTPYIEIEALGSTHHAYPDSALGEFRKWMREIYLPDKFPPYLLKKIREGALPASFAEAVQITFSGD